MTELPEDPEDPDLALGVQYAVGSTIIEPLDLIFPSHSTSPEVCLILYVYEYCLCGVAGMSNVVTNSTVSYKRVSVHDRDQIDQRSVS